MAQTSPFLSWFS